MALVIDIETLERLHVVPLPPITCVCLYDTATDVKYKLLFHKVENKEYIHNKNTLLCLLDKATCIIGYNIVFFDLEFIKRTFYNDVSDIRMSSWVLKTVDMFMCLKYIVKNTCKLNQLLQMNKLSLKTGSGDNAILLAEKEDWTSLLDYCICDVMLTYDLFRRINEKGFSEIVVGDNLKLYWNVFEIHKKKLFFDQVLLNTDCKKYFIQEQLTPMLTTICIHPDQKYIEFSE